MIVAHEVADTVDSAPREEISGHVGKQLGQFVLEARIGSGGMGTVYRARDTRSGTAVAVKVLFPELAAVPDVLARFMREAAALESLDHPGIVRGLTSGIHDGVSYLAMELIEGESLEARLLRGVTPEESARLVASIADALSAAHARGIVHRDLKPANVLIASDGTVKLVDFGVARFDVADGTLTHTDAVLGTFNYMAPEQRLRSRDVDHRADLFALGVILYRALTGTLPIGAYEKPSAINSKVPRDFDGLVAKLLASDREKRFASAPALSRALITLPRRRRMRQLGLAFATLFVIGASGGAVWATRTVPPVVSADSKVIESANVDNRANNVANNVIVPVAAPRDEPANQQYDPAPQKAEPFEPKLEMNENAAGAKASDNLKVQKSTGENLRVSTEAKKLRSTGPSNSTPKPTQKSQKQ
jgi:serine/threonine protein kinase